MEQQFDSSCNDSKFEMHHWNGLNIASTYVFVIVTGIISKNKNKTKQNRLDAIKKLLIQIHWDEIIDVPDPFNSIRVTTFDVYPCGVSGLIENSNPLEEENKHRKIKVKNLNSFDKTPVWNPNFLLVLTLSCNDWILSWLIYISLILFSNR